MDTYVGDYPLILGVQQDKDKKMLSYVLIDDKSYLEKLLGKESGVNSILTPLLDVKKEYVLSVSAPAFIPLVNPFSYHQDSVFQLSYDKKSRTWCSIDSGGVINKLNLHIQF